MLQDYSIGSEEVLHEPSPSHSLPTPNDVGQSGSSLIPEILPDRPDTRSSTPADVSEHDERINLDALIDSDDFSLEQPSHIGEDQDDPHGVLQDPLPDVDLIELADKVGYSLDDTNPFLRDPGGSLQREGSHEGLQEQGGIGGDIFREYEKIKADKAERDKRTNETIEMKLVSKKS